MFETNFFTVRPFTLTVRNRTKVLYKGPAKAVTSVNAKGRFDVLPEHTNFISIITDYIIIHGTDGSKQEIKLNRGVIKVSGSLVNVYLGVASRAPTPNPVVNAVKALTR